MHSLPVTRRDCAASVQCSRISRPQSCRVVSARRQLGVCSKSFRQTQPRWGRSWPIVSLRLTQQGIYGLDFTLIPLPPLPSTIFLLGIRLARECTQLIIDATA